MLTTKKKAAQNTSPQKTWVTCQHHFQRLLLHLQSKHGALGTGTDQHGPIRGGIRARWAWTNCLHQEKTANNYWGCQQVPRCHVCCLFRAAVSCAGPWRSPCWHFTGRDPHKKVDGEGPTARYELVVALCSRVCRLQNMRRESPQYCDNGIDLAFPIHSWYLPFKDYFSPQIFSAVINWNGYMLLLLKR